MEAVWADPRYTGSAFVRRARELGYRPKQIQAFVAAQESHQLNRQQGAVKYFPIWGMGPGSFQADLMFVENPRSRTKLLPILCAINVNTRYAYAYLLKSKEAAGIHEALSQFIKESQCRFLQTDNGKEFLNKSVSKLLADNGIQ